MWNRPALSTICRIFILLADFELTHRRPPLALAPFYTKTIYASRWECVIKTQFRLQYVNRISFVFFEENHNHFVLTVILFQWPVAVYCIGMEQFRIYKQSHLSIQNYSHSLKIYCTMRTPSVPTITHKERPHKYHIKTT